MRTLRLALVALCLAPTLSGCLAVGAAALATDVAVGTVSTAVKTAGNVGEAVIDVATPGDDDDDDR